MRMRMETGLGWDEDEDGIEVRMGKKVRMGLG